MNEDINFKKGLHADKELPNVHRRSLISSQNTLPDTNQLLPQKSPENVFNMDNERFLTEFSEKFSAYNIHHEFFNSLVEFVAEITHLDYVFVGKLEQIGDEPAVKTMALTAFGDLTDNITYPLPDGPCEQVVQGLLYAYPKHCGQIFPKNKTIEQFKVEGYLGYPLFDEAGNAIGLIAVMHEKEIDDPETVSAILKIVAKRAEIELERIRQREELLVNNQALGKKNEELEQMNSQLQAFTYISSHDLQEPLRKIQTFAERILEKDYAVLSDNGKNYFQRMHSAAKRMQTLIDDLLAYSLTSTSERKFEKADLGNIVEEVKIELADAILAKKAVIESFELGEANIIPFQFRQLINNLFSNALKFSKTDSPPHIIIKRETAQGNELQKENEALATDSLVQGRTYCHMSFTDNGIGFDPRYREKIFEVFQRLHGKAAYAGTGIGLAIVKKIMENHQGVITVNSKLDIGTTFDIYIPEN